jgi:D-alanyl-D-alanine carboxypeptidase/D-alanyl-D-alanine-endopeptidase (penicillin-binding protein 4)
MRSATAFVLSLMLVASPLAASDRLEIEIGAVIHAAEYKHAHWGILAVDLATGQTVYELDADRLFAPASVTKLFSTAAALDTLGADHRFIAKAKWMPPAYSRAI